jgi:hypothetical protein
VKSSEGKLSVILTIHQPNSRLLELFDHILLLDKGSNTFFGTLQQANNYFNGIGFPCPSATTPTDFFLKISDSNFKYTVGTNFKHSFGSSEEASLLHEMLQNHLKNAVNYDRLTGKWLLAKSDCTNSVPFIMQVYYLIYREYTLAGLSRSHTTLLSGLFSFHVCILHWSNFFQNAS